MAKQKIENLLKPTQVALIMERVGRDSMDFQIKMSETPTGNLEKEKDVKAMVWLAAGMLAHLKEHGSELIKKGKTIMEAAKEINVEQG